MKSVLNFFSKNKTAMAVLVLVVGVLCTSAAMTGCSLGSLIKHDVPQDMQEFNDGNEKVSLDDAPYVMEDYVSNVERNIRKFNEANERAHLIFDFLNSVATIGVEELGNSPIPGATILSGMLLGFAGLMIRKPGTAREVAEEKMASFNAGQDRTLAQVQTLVSPDTLRALLTKIKEDA